MATLLSLKVASFQRDPVRGSQLQLLPEWLSLCPGTRPGSEIQDSTGWAAGGRREGQIDSRKDLGRAPRLQSEGRRSGGLCVCVCGGVTAQGTS